MDELDDETLQRARAGDQAALCHIVKAYDRRLHKYLRARWLTPGHASASDVQDVAQEVFINALGALSRFVPLSQGGEGTFYNWLLRIADNKAHKWNRARRSKKRIPAEHVEDLHVEDLHENVHPMVPPPDRARAEQKKTAEEVLAKLPRELASVLVTYERDGMSYEEIASELGIPVSTVKSRLNRARAEAQRLAEKKTHEEGQENDDG